MLDEVRRRVQQQTLHQRGHKDDPLYKIRGLLRHGAEHLNERQIRKLDACLDAGDPNHEVTVAWRCYQQLRSIYHAARPAAGRAIAEKVIDSFATCPIPEVAGLGRTLRAWRVQVLAYFETGGVSNGGTEAINGVIEKTRRLAHGYRNFTNYRLRMPLAANGQRPYRRARPATPTRRQHRLPVVDDLDRRRQIVGIDPDEHLRHGSTSPRRGLVGIARRALLLRAGQSPLEPRLVTAPGGSANRKRATPIKLVGSREKSTPPDAWTESGRTPDLPTIV